MSLIMQNPFDLQAAVCGGKRIVVAQRSTAGFACALGGYNYFCRDVDAY